MTAKRAFWGSAFLLIGILLLASNLGYLEPFSVWGLWPILIIWPALRVVFGGSYVAVVDHGRREHIRVGRGFGVRLVALWILAGAVAELLHNLSLIVYDWGFVAYWTLPVLLVGLGIVILASPRERWSFYCGHRHWSGREWRKEWSEAGGDGSVSSFAGDIRLGRDPFEFKSPMKVDLWAGDIDVDLTRATFKPGLNTLYVHAWAADVDIEAPEGIDVTAEACCVAGEIALFSERRSGISVDARAFRSAHGREGDESGAEADSKAGGDSGQPRLLIVVDLTFGDVRVR